MVQLIIFIIAFVAMMNTISMWFNRKAERQQVVGSIFVVLIVGGMSYAMYWTAI
jgi:uncharacterized membrane-anchored protein